MPKLDTKWYKRKKPHLQIDILKSIASSGLASQTEITPKKASDYPLGSVKLTIIHFATTD
jgi:hypothetical protein